MPSRRPSEPVPEYMPKSVDDVRLRIERVLLGDREVPFLLSNSSSGFMFSGEGDGGREESVEAGVTSKVRCGIGR